MNITEYLAKKIREIITEADLDWRDRDDLAKELESIAADLGDDNSE